MTASIYVFFYLHRVFIFFKMEKHMTISQKTKKSQNEILYHFETAQMYYF